jgi:hypothetical protein
MAMTEEGKTSGLAATAISRLDLIPLQRERYDLVIPKTYYESLQGLKTLLDLIVGKPFRGRARGFGRLRHPETGKVIETVS